MIHSFLFYFCHVLVQMHTILLWLGLMCPIILSPGPANLYVASNASLSGFKSTVPLMLGFTTINLIASVMIGLLFFSIVKTMPGLFQALGVLGACYICYLGVTFIKPKPLSKANKKTTHPPGYRSALVLQLLNGKIYSALAMMFTVFMSSTEHKPFNTMIISISFCLLALFSYLCWSSLGTILNKIFHGSRGQMVQRYMFGGLLLLVGINLLIHSFM